MRDEGSSSDSGSGDDGMVVAVAPPEKAKPEATKIREKADALWDLVGLITGNAGDMRTAFSGMASQFSDFVREDISSEADYDEDKWSKAAFTLVFGAEVAHQWADDVENYDDERLELFRKVKRKIQLFRASATRTYEMETGQSPYVDSNPLQPSLGRLPYSSAPEPILPGSLGPSSVQPDTVHDYGFYNSRSPVGELTPEYIAWRDQKIQQIIDKYHSDSETLQEGLVKKGRNRTDTLGRGPDNDLSVRQLVEAGYMKWAAFNILGPEENPPLPVSKQEGRKMATELEAYIHGDKTPDARYAEILTTVGAISAKAKVMQGLDDEMPRNTIHQRIPNRWDRNNLDRNEIDFLSTLLSGLDAEVRDSSANDQPGGGLLYLPALHIGENDERNVPSLLDREQRESLIAALGEGMLIVSNEELGGGYDRLPESVRTFADGKAVYSRSGVYNNEPEQDSEGWMQGATYLERFLNEAGPQLRGGSEFSANVTTSMGHHLNGIDNDKQDWDEPLSSLLDIAARNEDASHAVLADEHVHPTFEKNANALKGLFTHDWTDDGAELSGLTGWIPEAAESDETGLQTRAQEASLGLMRMLTEDEDRVKDFQDTGVSVTLPNGDEVSGAAFTLLNPKLATSLTDVATTYLYDLSTPGPAQGSNGSPVFEILSNPEVSDRDLLQVDLASRQKFFSYLMADGSSATHLYTTLNNLEGAGVHPLMEDDGAITSAGADRGRLRALLDSSLRLEALNRTGQDLADQGDTDTRDRVFANLRTAAYAGTGFFKHPAAAAGSFVLAGAGFQEYDMRFNQDDVSPNYQSIANIGITDPNSPFAPTEYGRTLQAPNVEYKTRLEMLDWRVRNGDLSIEDVRAQDDRLVTDDGESIIEYGEFNRVDRDLDGRADRSTVNRNIELLLDEVDSAHPIPGKNSTALNEADSFTDSYVRAYEEVFNKTFPDVSLDEAEEFWQSK